MNSEFKYIPNPRCSPCYKTRECKHHKEINGKCRNKCSSFKKYKDILELVHEKKNIEHMKDKTDRVRTHVNQ